jgi:molecular chaperone DnaJ
MPAETRDKMKADFYETLGVAKGADDKGSRAPIANAMQFHPDRNPGDHAAGSRIKEIERGL